MSPYISIQAVDADGNKSAEIQLRNPFYVPSLPVVTPTPNGGTNGLNGEAGSSNGEGLDPDDSSDANGNINGSSDLLGVDPEDEEEGDTSQAGLTAKGYETPQQASSNLSPVGTG